MAHDVQLRYRDHLAEVTTHPEMPKDGLAKAETLIHYNFDSIYARVGDWRVHDLHGKTGRETIVTLAKIVATLGIVETEDDPIASTDGNAGRVIYYLLQWAVEHPEAEWRVS